MAVASLYSVFTSHCYWLTKAMTGLVERSALAGQGQCQFIL